ncbi:MAG TPA: cytochrome c biogenesis protein CcdA, partial [Bryobacteraceae bacterium]
MRAVRAIVGLLACAFGAFAEQHVQWTIEGPAGAVAPGGTALVRVKGTVEAGWHLYSASSPAGIPTSFQAGPETVVSGLKTFQPKPKRAFDPNFNSDTETFEGDVAFLLEAAIRKDALTGPAQLAISSRFQTCSDKVCVPGRWSGTADLKIDPATAVAAVSIPAGYTEAKAPAAGSGAEPLTQAEGLGAFLAVAFGFGLASIFTPCVFPMIPITMSYFLNRESATRRDTVVQAVVFCLGIVVLFSGLGLAATAILGPFGIAQLGANPWVNGFIAALFIAFGFSLLGAFEITIPSSILTRLNASSEKGGFGGTLLMGLTFSLASFACVGPFVGTLLAASVSNGGSRPLIGMVTFALGLALPFFLLALFPSYLKRLPRSGGWMARVKVVMGFVILAASLKYLSSLDQVLGWGVLTRERFLAAWIVLFALAGLYLLGFLRLEGIKPDQAMGLGRLLTGAAFLVFAISLWPGMFGGKLGDLDAYVPAAVNAGGAGGGTGESALAWIKDDYKAALERARSEGKLLFVNFTGVACANCHWMEANMLSRPEVAGVLKGFVLVELFTDRADAVSQSNGDLQLAKFQTAATPFYAILDANEKVVATYAGKTGDATEYLAFLNKGAGAVPAATAASAAAAAPAAVSGSTGAGLKYVALDGKPVETAGKVVVLNFWA